MHAALGGGGPLGSSLVEWSARNSSLTGSSEATVCTMLLLEKLNVRVPQAVREIRDHLRDYVRGEFRGHAAL